MSILISQIVIGEFEVFFSYAVMLIWREFMKIPSFWREIQIDLERQMVSLWVTLFDLAYNEYFYICDVMLSQSVIGAKNSIDFSKELRKSTKIPSQIVWVTKSPLVSPNSSKILSNKIIFS